MFVSKLEKSISKGRPINITDSIDKTVTSNMTKIYIMPGVS